MKKINKITSLVICVMMILSCFPSFTIVNAEVVTENLVVVDEVTNVYSDISEAINWKEIIRTDKYANFTSIILDEYDNYLTLYHDDDDVFKPNGEQNGQATYNLTRDFKDTLVIKDDTYLTNVTADALSGKYKLELSLEGYMKLDPAVSTAFWDIILKNDKSEMVLQNRVRKNSTDFMSSDSSKTDKLATIGTLSLDLTTKPQDFTLVFTFDTVTGEVECYRTDVPTKVESTIIDNKTPVAEIFVQSLARIGKGSYLKFKEVKVTQLSLAKGSELTAILGELPETLVEKDSINNLKNDIELKNIDGVTWSSSNDDVLDPKTGKITRSQEGDMPVVVTASFTADGINYKKNYNLTVAKSGVLVDYYADGERIEQIEITKGEIASQVSAPEKEHYDFVGWYDSLTNEEFDFSTSLYEHVELYAKYEPKTYNVYFKKDGELVKTLTGKYGSTVTGTIPDIPEKDGYTAVDWVIDGTEDVFDDNTIINRDITVNATYVEGVIKKYSVKFVVDGNVYAEEEVIEGYAVEMPINPEKENYVFEKWQLDGVDYSTDAPVVSDITLNAVFKPAEFEIAFYDDDKTTKLYDGKGYYNQKYTDLPENPSKSGWVFAGWTLEDGTVFNADYVITKAVSVYATYTSNAKVIYDVDFTKIKTKEEAERAGWIFKPTEYSDAGIFSDGGIGFWQLKSLHTTDGTKANSKQETPLAARFAGILEEDKDNRTVLKVVNLRGAYQLDLCVEQSISESYPSDFPGTKSSSFAQLKVGYLEGDDLSAFRIGPLHYRVYNAKINPFNASDSAGNDLKSITTKSGAEYTVHVMADTRNDQVTTWVDDGEKQSGKVYEELDYFNGIGIGAMQRFGVGSYMKFKNAKITLLEEDTESFGYAACMEAIAQLPDKLCDNPFNVTEDIELKEIEKVTWTSSLPQSISETGKVTHLYDDAEVVITATISSGLYKYVKEYTLTVPKNPDITSEVKIDKEFDSESDLLNWYFPLNDSEDAVYNVDENGIKFEKISASEDLTTERKTNAYNAYFDLYSEVSEGIYTSDSMGVYDVDLSLSKNITSKAPAIVSVGYRSGDEFYSAGTLDFADGKITFRYRTTLESEEKINIANTHSLTNYKLRIDTVNNKLWVFVDGKNLTTYGVSFANPMPAGMDFKINSLRVSMDKNNGNGDYVLVDSVKLTKQESLTVENLSYAVNAAKSLADDTVTSKADALEGYINNLPETTGKYNIEWKSSTKQIDKKTGEVYHSKDPVDAVVSAYVSDSTLDVPVVVRRDFKVTIRAAKNNEELTKFELNELGNITNQPYDDIRYDICLPETDGVVWTSTDTSVVSNDGKINRNLTLYEDKNVILKAAKNGIVKEYPITVSKYAPFNVMASGSDIAGEIFVKADGIGNVVFTGDILVNFALEAGKTNEISLLDSNDSLIAKIIQSDEGVAFDYASSDDKIYAFNGIANVSVYVMPEKGRLSVTMNDEIIADYVGTKTEIDNFAKVVLETNIKSVEVCADAYSELQANIDNIDYDCDIEKGYVVKDIDLVTNTIFGAVAEWSSSDESLVSSVGKVTNKEKIEYATIGFTLRDGEDSNIKLAFNNKVAVDIAESRNIAPNATVKVNCLETPIAPKKNINDNNINTAFKFTEATNAQYVIYDFNSAATFNTLYVNHDGNLNDYVISVSSDSSTWKDIKIGSFDENIESRVINLDEIQTARYLRFMSENAKESSVDINELRVYLIADATELAKIDINAISLPKNATDDIELPTVGLNGTKFIWSTSDENVIDAEGNVTTPEKAVTVVLTVKNDDGTVSRTFNVTVKGKGGSGGPSVVGGGSGSGGGGSAGGSAGASTGMFPGVKPGDSFGAGETVEEPEIVKPSTTYSDVNKADWYYEPVMKLTEMGVVSGDGTGMFNPKDHVTREQFVKMIIIAAGIELSDNTNTFDDVNSGEWYEDYVATAVSTGIVNGVGNGRFGIGTDISRQDMAVIISRILEKKGHTFDEEFEKFKDDKNISKYAYDAVYTMKGLGIIEGFEGNFNPKDNLTRAEAATVIVTLTEILESK